MMGLLAFVQECAAVAAFTGMMASLPVGVALLVLWLSALRRFPGLRADGAFVLGTLPALAEPRSPRCSSRSSTPPSSTTRWRRPFTCSHESPRGHATAPPTHAHVYYFR